MCKSWMNVMIFEACHKYLSQNKSNILKALPCKQCVAYGPLVGAAE